MDYWKKFTSFKQRGEWVELLFMAIAAEYGFYILKPWGETRPYDVGIEHASNFLRVQVKSTTCRTGTGYFCQFMPHGRKEHYKLSDLDLFAAYVIPVKTWYIIPAALLLGDERKTGIMLHPVEPLKKNRYSYEAYKEAWPLLYKSRRALVERTRQPQRGGK
ncbi:MAG TPA: group I intron-associated PD-(D/E)XK endonuclease [Candidatus Sulfotelmatobacter sp.]|jgi:hypothetical protein|nr:group I intron-associated PD-(D/E)XK endonuclease [Candidatus Sulfotelmatobacter sp.]